MKSSIVILISVLAVILPACTVDPPEPLDNAMHTHELAGVDLPAAREEALAVAAASSRYIVHRDGDQPESLSDLIPLPGGAAAQVTTSYTRTCRPLNEWITDRASGAMIRAWSTGGCKKFNGTYTRSSAWAGWCTTDVSNCNGQIVCQNRCP